MKNTAETYLILLRFLKGGFTNLHCQIFVILCNSIELVVFFLRKIKENIISLSYGKK